LGYQQKVTRVLPLLLVVDYWKLRIFITGKGSWPMGLANFLPLTEEIGPKGI